MPADVHHATYTIPRFSRRTYTVWMKTLTSSAVYDAHDPVAFRLKVVEHARDFGWRSTVSAFGVGKSTLYDWRKRYLSGGRRIATLIPASTRPRRVRVMQTPPSILAFIKSVRESDYAMSKYKIKPLLDVYCQTLGIRSIAPSTIGKIIKRNRWTLPHKRRAQPARSSWRRTRRRYAPRVTTPGHIEMDSILLWILGRRWCFMSVIDVASRYGYCTVVQSLTSLEAVRVFGEFRQQFTYPVTVVQTDNGSEFLGDFHDALGSARITHEFIYPRSPKINGIVERFNRTVQEECIQRSDAVFYDPVAFREKLSSFVIWYNTRRPHMSLHLQTPVQVLQQFTSSIPESM